MEKVTEIIKTVLACFGIFLKLDLQHQYNTEDEIGIWLGDIFIPAICIPRKRMIIVSRSMGDIPEKEITALILHEIGHIRNGDGMLTKKIKMILLIYLIIQIIAHIYLKKKLGIGFFKRSMMLGFLYIPADILTREVSLYRERLADMYVKRMGHGEEFIKFLLRFEGKSINILHPPVKKRIEYINNDL